jgi:hypothetical protein
MNLISKREISKMPMMLKEQYLRIEGVIASDNDFFEWLAECCGRL